MKIKRDLENMGLLLEDEALMAAGAFADSPAVDFKMVLPQFIDNSGYCMPPSDQGSTSACTAFSTDNGIEAWNWFMWGVFQQNDSFNLYKKIKQIDGSPNSKGSTLSAATEAALQLGRFPAGMKITPRKCTTPEEVAYAIHHNGGCLVGFNMSENWSKPNKNGLIPDGGRLLGGHAIWVSSFWRAGWEKHALDDGSMLYWGFPNSWGTGWGCGGFGVLSHKEFKRQFMHGLAWDWKKAA